MKTISTRELRQNPSQMVHDVQSDEVYSLTLHGRQVGSIVPVQTPVRIVPPKRTDPVDTSVFTRHELETAESIEELLEEMQGDW
ncbi:type II toxin-antitoxin system Phd/YefM family antitoxin [Ornithinimicrobium faecis]|uniref:type II toxin-antitoxin system Phd/YefM family antitoxin n=1 Tax=Ornithinimicrobium faecis TaxID=2934158 RepID=UPI00211737B4|nr:type II toxin-antitoxin system Phd/YefM family antitoxin [Ornithinimicrobium sp. HY1745]